MIIVGDSEEKKDKLQWANELFLKFVHHQMDTDNLLHLSIEGISVLRMNPKIVEFLGEREYGIRYKERLQYAEHHVILRNGRSITTFHGCMSRQHLHFGAVLRHSFVL